MRSTWCGQSNASLTIFVPSSSAYAAAAYARVHCAILWSLMRVHTLDDGVGAAGAGLSEGGWVGSLAVIRAGSSCAGRL